MILLLAGRDTASTMRRLLRSADRNGVSVLPPAGLSAPGWRHDPERPDGDRLIIDGQVRRPDQLTAVITALDAVAPSDLPHVVAADRSFVAAEMTAFLRSWLRTLACPVLDRPTMLALSGSAGDRAVWSRAAAELGVPDRQTSPAPRTRTCAVTVVAGRVIGPAPAAGRRDCAVPSPVGRGDRRPPDVHRRRGPARSRPVVAQADARGAAGLAGPRPGAFMNAVLLWGLPEDEPLAAVHQALQGLGTQVLMIDQRRALSTHIRHGPGGPLLTAAGPSSPARGDDRRLPAALPAARRPGPAPRGRWHSVTSSGWRTNCGSGPARRPPPW